MMHWTVHLKGAPKEGDQPPAVAAGPEVYAFGGSTFVADQIPVNVFNTVTFLWTNLPPVTNRKGIRPQHVPCWRMGHTAVLIKDTAYICGGETLRRNICKCKPYAFNVRTHDWSKPKVSGTVPDARCDGAACALGGNMYLHGGIMRHCIYANDIHKLDTRTMVWSAIVPTGGQPPPHAALHSANVIGTKVFVFGGEGDNYVRVFDTMTSRWQNHPSLRLHPQGQRMYHSAFAWHGELYVFGSKKQRKPRNLWKFSPEKLSWTKVRCKGKRPNDNWMCCCLVGDCLVLFGGGSQYYDTVHDDLYILDLSPSLKTLCKLEVIWHNLDQAGLPHNVRWELEAMTGKEHPKPTEKKEDTEKKEAGAKNTFIRWRY